MKLAGGVALAIVLFSWSCFDHAPDVVGAKQPPIHVRTNYSYSVELARVELQSWTDSDPGAAAEYSSDTGSLQASLELDYGEDIVGGRGVGPPTIVQADFEQHWNALRGGTEVSSGSVRGTCALPAPTLTGAGEQLEVDAAAGASDSNRDPAIRALGRGGVLFSGEEESGSSWILSPAAVEFLLAPCGELVFTDTATGSRAVDVLATLRGATRAAIHVSPRSGDDAEFEEFELEGSVEGRLVHLLGEERSGGEQTDSMQVELRGRLRRSRRNPREFSTELTGVLRLEVQTSGPLSRPDGVDDRFHARSLSRGPLRIVLRSQSR